MFMANISFNIIDILERKILNNDHYDLSEWSLEDTYVLERVANRVRSDIREQELRNKQLVKCADEEKE